MTKQEEIREGTQGHIDFCIRNPDYGHIATADDIIKDLYTQGVVIKGVCPICKGNKWIMVNETNGDTPSMHNETCPKCTGLGYTVEPLIKGG